jgi:SAM-dependent methyltransferase
MENIHYKNLAHLSVKSTEDSAITLCGKEIKFKTIVNTEKDIPICPECFYKYKIRNRTREDIMVRAFDQIINAQRVLVNPQDHKNMYPFIPMGTDRICKDFISLHKFLRSDERWSGYQKSQVKFLDAGCGCGNVLLLAASVGLTSTYTGIEFDKNNVANANNIIGPSKRFEIINGDIIRFKKYHEYDIIYFYCPFSNSYLQKKFENIVKDQMKIGSVLMPYMKQDRSIDDDRRFEKFGISTEHAYIKINKRRGKKKASKEIYKRCSLRSVSVISEL